jgi:hypothetical protein
VSAADNAVLEARRALSEALGPLLLDLLRAEVALVRLGPDRRGSMSQDVVEVISQGETCRPRQIF